MKTQVGIIGSHDGFVLAFDGRSERIDMAALTNGQGVMVWGQTQVMRDLIDAHLDAGGMIKYECPALAIEEFIDGTPQIIYEEHGERKTLTCDFVMGCDGYHGVSRQSVPAKNIQTYEKIYPFD